jgi:hypothetical protein
MSISSVCSSTGTTSTCRERRLATALVVEGLIRTRRWVPASTESVP